MVEIEDYKSYRIRFSPTSEDFIAYDVSEKGIDKEVARAKTLTQCKLVIDRWLKEQFGSPIEALDTSNERLCKITSKDASDDRGKTVWVTWENEREGKGRAKESILLYQGWGNKNTYRFVKPTESNINILAKIKMLEKQIEEIQDEREKLKTQYTEPLTFGLDKEE